MSKERILFVTGRLAEPSLEGVLRPLAERVGFEYQVLVLGISVAALMHVDWVRRKLQVPEGINRVVLPGWCSGDMDVLSRHYGVPFVRGPKNLFELPEFFGRGENAPPALDHYNIEILAEINHAPYLSDVELIRQASVMRDAGADMIDLGCIPGEPWKLIAQTIKCFRSEGFRVSVDSFERTEVEPAVEAGAELVLSCNQSNMDWACELPVEFVVVPDDFHELGSWDITRQRLETSGRKYRLDPVLEPIGFGFAESLQRYHATRRSHPTAEMLMGIGNLTELTEVDSAGVNFLLAAICEELRIRSILTTEVINWGRTAIKEFNLARRLVRHAIENRVLPKHLGGQLVLLRDPKVSQIGEQGLHQFAQRLTDPNFRVFAESGQIHLMNRDGYWRGSDPYEVFDQMIAAVGSLSAEHSFYLGIELCKARTALTLGKQYIQDEALRWGFLTIEEVSAKTRRKHLSDRANARAREYGDGSGNF